MTLLGYFRTIIFWCVASLAAVASAHDLSLTTLDLAEVGGHVRLKLETPLSRLVLRDGLSSNPSGIALDQSIRGQLSLVQGNSQIQPEKASIEVDSRADMIRWQTEIPASLNSLGVAKRFYSKDERSVMQISLHDAAGHSRSLILDNHHPSWNADTEFQSSPKFARTRDIERNWLGLLLAVQLGFWFARGCSLRLLYIAAGIAFVGGVLLMRGHMASSLPFALVVLSLVCLLPGQVNPTRSPWFMVLVASMFGFLICVSVDPILWVRINLLAIFFAITMLTLWATRHLLNRNMSSSQKVIYVASTIFGMVGTYQLILSLTSHSAYS